MLAQLETEHMSANLTLQKLWYFVLPTMHTMQVLAAIVTNIGKVSVPAILASSHSMIKFALVLLKIRF